MRIYEHIIIHTYTYTLKHRLLVFFFPSFFFFCIVCFFFFLSLCVKFFCHHKINVFTRFLLINFEEVL
uniref:Uncharacterized protein n=1 Tax=Octopus bimaculoides TaxID=37653 RepID=A0A0L8G612_OCTBM